MNDVDDDDEVGDETVRRLPRLQRHMLFKVSSVSYLKLVYKAARFCVTTGARVLSVGNLLAPVVVFFVCCWFNFLCFFSLISISTPTLIPHLLYV